MQITTILAFITAMGGLEAVKWMVRYISCRKTDARKEEADVSSLEEENRRKKVDWLEDRLAQRDEKIDGLYICLLYTSWKLIAKMFRMITFYLPTF